MRQSLSRPMLCCDWFLKSGGFRRVLRCTQNMGCIMRRLFSASSADYFIGTKKSPLDGGLRFHKRSRFFSFQGKVGMPS